MESAHLGNDLQMHVTLDFVNILKQTHRFGILIIHISFEFLEVLLQLDNTGSQLIFVSNHSQDLFRDPLVLKLQCDLNVAEFLVRFRKVLIIPLETHLSKL